MVGSGLGAKRGVLFKDAVALEQAAGLDTVVFDKTGTLTRGEPQVVAVATADGVSKDELLRLVAAAEGDSEHPLARAIVNAAKSRGLPVPAADGFTAVPGAGAIATVDGKRLAVGNGRLLDREHVAPGGLTDRAAALTAEGRTVVQVAIDGRAAAVIAIADAPRDSARGAVSALRQLGVRTVMLTGDNRVTAGRVAAEVGIGGVIAEVLPGDKEAKVSELQRQGRSAASVPGRGRGGTPGCAFLRRGAHGVGDVAAQVVELTGERRFGPASRLPDGGASDRRDAMASRASPCGEDHDDRWAHRSSLVYSSS